MTLKVFLFFAAFRIANVFLIQSQFDPDEYWQNLEPSYCYVFGDESGFNEGSSCPGLTWEWKRRSQSHSERTPTSSDDEPLSLAVINFLLFGLEGPVRSFASILPTLIFYAIIKKFQWDSSWMVSRGPLIVNAVFVAAVTDWTVWYSSKWMRSSTKERSNYGKDSGQQTDIVFWCIFCQLSSWFNAYALTRTYSNSLETVLLSLSFALVSQEFLSPLDKPNASKRSTLKAWFAFFFGGLCVSIRFTCLVAYIPMGIILARKTKFPAKYLFAVCGLAGFLGFLSTVLLDRAMFGIWAIPVLGNFHFNVIQGNGSLYGTHPFYWYFVAGVPALAGILFPVLVYDLMLGTWDPPKRNLWTVVACYIIAHSSSEHKEFRFLLPILPMICLLCGTRIQHLVTSSVGLSRKRQLVMVCAVPNLVAILYLGLFHQRAPIEVNRAILKAVSASGNPTDDPVRVHYLMGCHSTPLLSHLHAPPSKFEPWYLDCSPKCRKNREVDCESDAFSNDPDTFVKETYYCDGEENEDQTCFNNEIGGRPARETPDFIVCNANDLKKMETRLASMGMKDIGRFVQCIDGIQLNGGIATGDEEASGSAFSVADLLGTFVSLSYEELVVLQRL